MLSYTTRSVYPISGDVQQVHTQQHTQHTQRHDRTVQCTKCTTHHGAITPPYVSYYVPTATKPQYCPKCSHQRIIREYDYADVLCTDHVGLSRSNAITAIQSCNEHNARTSAPYGTSRYVTVEQLLDKLGARELPPITAVITPLTVRCNSPKTANSAGGCGATFTLLRNVPDVQRTPPLYCIFCAQPVTILNNLNDTEETAFIGLSLHYELPLIMIKSLYVMWSTSSQRPTFESYIHSPKVRDTIQQVLANNNIEVPLQHQTPATPVATTQQEVA